MALKAGYKGIKNNLFNKLKAMAFISEIGDGLTLEDGELSATGGGGADLSVIAPAFSDATAYSIGDYVTYSDKLYRFTSAHVAGAWNSEEVTEVTVTGDLKVNTENIEKSYKTDDGTESAIVDADYVPFFDSSAASGAGAPKKSTWSNIKAKLKAYFDTLYSSSYNISTTEALTGFTYLNEPVYVKLLEFESVSGNAGVWLQTGLVGTDIDKYISAVLYTSQDTAHSVYPVIVATSGSTGKIQFMHFRPDTSESFNKMIIYYTKVTT